MKILFGFDGIVVEKTESEESENEESLIIPTASDLCAMDKRLLYIGTFTDSKGNTIHDAFMHVLRPQRYLTIKGIRKIKKNEFMLEIETHYFEKESPVLQNLYDNYDEELYVGDVCDGSGETGEVWHDTYKRGLDSTTLYTKNEDGSINIVNPPEKNCFSVIDRFGFRVVLKTPDEPEKHYAFFYGISAFNLWTYLQYHATEGQEVLHSLDPNYKKFLHYEECEQFEEYPQLVRAYPKCYSTKGFLDLK